MGQQELWTWAGSLVQAAQTPMPESPELQMRLPAPPKPEPSAVVAKGKKPPERGMAQWPSAPLWGVHPSPDCLEGSFSAPAIPAPCLSGHSVFLSLWKSQPVVVTCPHPRLAKQSKRESSTVLLHLENPSFLLLFKEGREQSRGLESRCATLDPTPSQRPLS